MHPLDARSCCNFEPSLYCHYVVFLAEQDTFTVDAVHDDLLHGNFTKCSGYCGFLLVHATETREEFLLHV